MHNYEEILDGLIELTRLYAGVYRFSCDPARLRSVDNTTQDFLDLSIREPLLSHVGHAPILASHLHEYVSSPVDLGHSLRLLAIHDIGELDEGDVMVTHMDATQEDREEESAKKRLSSEQFSWFVEFRDLRTLEAKFAKSIDKICPDLVAFVADPNIEKRRIAFHNHRIQDFYDYKKPYMQWDSFLSEFYEHLMERGVQLLGN